MDDLKPCPFCGGKLNFYRESYVNRPETGYPGEYAEKWNRRADNG